MVEQEKASGRSRQEQVNLNFQSDRLKSKVLRSTPGEAVRSGDLALAAQVLIERYVQYKDLDISGNGPLSMMRYAAMARCASVACKILLDLNGMNSVSRKGIELPRLETYEIFSDLTFFYITKGREATDSFNKLIPPISKDLELIINKPKERPAGANKKPASEPR